MRFAGRDPHESQARRQGSSNLLAAQFKVVEPGDGLILSGELDSQALAAVDRLLSIERAKQAVHAAAPVGFTVELFRAPVVRAALETPVGHQVRLGPGSNRIPGPY